MRLYLKAIPLEAEVIAKIVESIGAAEHVCKDELASFDCPTDNGNDGMCWNFINREIIRVLEGGRFQITVMRRGIWKLIGIYDKQTKYFYTLMRNKTFNNLRKNASKKLMHYMNALSRLNSKLSEEYDLLEEQLILGEEFSLGKTYLAKLDDVLGVLLKDIVGDINAYALISFDMHYGQVCQLEGIIPSVGMNYFARENWTEYIGVASESSTVASCIEANCTSDDADNIADGNGKPLLCRKRKKQQIAK